MIHAAGLGGVEEPAALLDAVLDGAELADGNGATEAARPARPEEADEGRGSERTESGAHQGDGGTVEELTTRDADDLGVGGDPGNERGLVVDGRERRAGAA